MAIFDAMKNAWHNHPYLIVGVGGVIALYFLWPSKSSTPASGSNDYATQLAAETQLSQTQLAEQTQADIAHWEAGAAENAAAAQATAASNTAIAESNAAAIISYNQTAQAYIGAESTIGQAQIAGNSTDFQALIAGLLGFSQGAQSGINDATNAGVNSYLASIGADFSNHENGNSFNANNSFVVGHSATGVVSIADWIHGIAGGWGEEHRIRNNFDGSFVPSTANFDNYVSNTTGAFANQDNLLAGLWNQMIAQFGQLQSRPLPVLPLPPGTNTQGQLVGNVQPVPLPVALPSGLHA